jgi:hypothetical protein
MYARFSVPELRKALGSLTVPKKRTPGDKWPPRLLVACEGERATLSCGGSCEVISCEVATPGSVNVFAAKFRQMVRLCEDDGMTIVCVGDGAEIRHGRARYRMLDPDAAEIAKAREELSDRPAPTEAPTAEPAPVAQAPAPEPAPAPAHKPAKAHKPSKPSKRPPDAKAHALSANGAALVDALRTLARPARKAEILPVAKLPASAWSDALSEVYKARAVKRDRSRADDVYHALA